MKLIKVEDQIINADYIANYKVMVIDDEKDTAQLWAFYANPLSEYPIPPLDLPSQLADINDAPTEGADDPPAEDKPPLMVETPPLETYPKPPFLINAHFGGVCLYVGSYERCTDILNNLFDSFRYDAFFTIPK